MRDNRSSPLRRRHAHTRRDVAGRLPTGFASRGCEYGDAGVSSLQLQARASATVRLPSLGAALLCMCPRARTMTSAHLVYPPHVTRFALQRSTQACILSPGKMFDMPWYCSDQHGQPTSAPKRRSIQARASLGRKALRKHRRTQFPSLGRSNVHTPVQAVTCLSSAKHGRANTSHNANSVPHTGQHPSESGIFHILMPLFTPQHCDGNLAETSKTDVTWME